MENESIQSCNDKKKIILSETAFLKVEECLPEHQIKFKLKPIDFSQHKKFKKKTDRLIGEKNNNVLAERENSELLPGIFRETLKVTKKSLSSSINREIKENLAYKDKDTNLCSTTQQKVKKPSLIDLINEEDENYLIPIIGYMIFCKIYSLFSRASNVPKQRINLVVKDTKIKNDVSKLISVLADSINFKMATNSRSQSIGFMDNYEYVTEILEEEINDNVVYTRHIYSSNAWEELEGRIIGKTKKTLRVLSTTDGFCIRKNVINISVESCLVVDLNKIDFKKLEYEVYCFFKWFINGINESFTKEKNWQEVFDHIVKFQSQNFISSSKNDSVISFYSYILWVFTGYIDYLSKNNILDDEERQNWGKRVFRVARAINSVDETTGLQNERIYKLLNYIWNLYELGQLDKRPSKYETAIENKCRGFIYDENRICIFDTIIDNAENILRQASELDKYKQVFASNSGKTKKLKVRFNDDETKDMWAFYIAELNKLFLGNRK
ncbi:MAG: hypothetical protein AB9836_06875 [Aminipila sp.]